MQQVLVEAAKLAPDTATNWLWSTSESDYEGTKIARRSP
jgi:hypothetical protein